MFAMDDETITLELGERTAPNPQDWTTASGAALILGCSRTAVYQMVEREVLNAHRLNGSWGGYFFWVPELRLLAAARARVAGRG